MDRRVLLGITVTLALGGLPATVLAQAAAESALLNGSLASSTVKAGSAMTQGSKQLAGRIQGRISKGLPGEVQLIEHKQQELELKSQAGGETVRTNSVPEKPAILVISIQGAEVACAPPNLKTQVLGKTNIESRPTNCRSKDLALETGLPNKYKSFIALSFPK